MLFFRAKVLLGYSSREAWRLTVRQICALFDEYCYFNNIKKRPQEETDISEV